MKPTRSRIKATYQQKADCTAASLQRDYLVFDPTGWHSFECTPRLVPGWNKMALRDIQAFGIRWSLEVERNGHTDSIRIKNAMGTILYDRSLPEGSTHTIDLSKVN